MKKVGGVSDALQKTDSCAQVLTGADRKRSFAGYEASIGGGGGFGWEWWSCNKEPQCETQEVRLSSADREMRHSVMRPQSHFLQRDTTTTLGIVR